MSDPSAPSSKLREQRSRKRCQDKEIMAQDLWPSIRLHGIRILTKLHGIKLQGTRCLSIRGLSRDLFQPVIVANPSSTNPSIPKNCRRWKMINTAGSDLFGCKV